MIAVAANPAEVSVWAQGVRVALYSLTKFEIWKYPGLMALPTK